MSVDISCRRAAVFSDIHSNYHAFRACFEDALAQGADCFLFLGDYVSDLAEPRKTLDLVYEIQENYPTVCLRGNRERYMLEYENGTSTFSPGSKTGSLLYTYGQLQPRDLAFFKGLPISDIILLNGIPFEIAHAVRDNDRCYFDTHDGNLRSVFPQMRCTYLLTGHSHKQYIQSAQGRTVINPGSIGVPRDYGYLAQYALLEFDRGTLRYRFRQIPYDIRAAIRSQFESGLMALAPCWAVSILYDVITGEEYTLPLLERVHRAGDVSDENIWRAAAAQMGMKFTEKDILDFFHDRIPGNTQNTVT